ncbi:hypothetical protein K488DRAFT_81608 [Vararia minispora EC-137]|uniref:Uncharacterized protein n=1 Tax=Vararia minispora EC-137 TaxID=1314806 RepID=A0ACB8QZ73_9AGAM|nr:hypothetical protein K488DRAFT_81608 [Vararia minispora EC-137]
MALTSLDQRVQRLQGALADVLACVRSDRLKLERSQADFDTEKSVFERRKQAFDTDKATLEQDRAALERERALVDGQKGVLEQERKQLACTLRGALERQQDRAQAGEDVDRAIEVLVRAREREVHAQKELENTVEGLGRLAQMEISECAEEAGYEPSLPATPVQGCTTPLYAPRPSLIPRPWSSRATEAVPRQAPVQVHFILHPEKEGHNLPAPPAMMSTSVPMDTEAAPAPGSEVVGLDMYVGASGAIDAAGAVDATPSSVSDTLVGSPIARTVYAQEDRSESPASQETVRLALQPAEEPLSAPHIASPPTVPSMDVGENEVVWDAPFIPHEGRSPPALRPWTPRPFALEYESGIEHAQEVSAEVEHNPLAPADAAHVTSDAASDTSSTLSYLTSVEEYSSPLRSRGPSEQTSREDEDVQRRSLRRVRNFSRRSSSSPSPLSDRWSGSESNEVEVHRDIALRSDDVPQETVHEEVGAWERPELEPHDSERTLVAAGASDKTLRDLEAFLAALERAYPLPEQLSVDIYNSSVREPSPIANVGIATCSISAADVAKPLSAHPYLCARILTDPEDALEMHEVRLLRLKDVLERLKGEKVDEREREGLESRVRKELGFLASWRGMIERTAVRMHGDALKL